VCNVSAVVAVDAELYDSSFDAVRRSEDAIVSQWEGLSVSTQEVRERVDEVLQPLGLQTRLLVVQKANSLALLFTCLTLSALMSLRDQWCTRQLRDIVQSLFQLLSGAIDRVYIKRLTWPVTDYERCVNFFHSFQGD